MKTARLLRQRFGIHTSILSVRPRGSWYWRASRVLAFVVLAVGVGWWLYQMGRGRASEEFAPTYGTVQQLRLELAKLSTLASKLKSDNETLAGEVTILTNQATVDTAAQSDLTRTIGELQNEIAHLKDEVAFYDKVVSGGGEPNKLDVREFRVQREIASGAYRYQALIFQSGSRSKAFRGRVQLVLTTQLAGRDVSQVLQTAKPTNNKDKAGDLNFKYYERLSGSFSLPAGATFKGLEIRVFEVSGSEPKLVRHAVLS